VHFAALHDRCCGNLTYGTNPKLAESLGCNGSGCMPDRFHSRILRTAGS
jgi:hypothetical protein